MHFVVPFLLGFLSRDMSACFAFFGFFLASSLGLSECNVCWGFPVMECTENVLRLSCKASLTRLVSQRLPCNIGSVRFTDPHKPAISKSEAQDTVKLKRKAHLQCQGYVRLRL